MGTEQRGVRAVPGQAKLRAQRLCPGACDQHQPAQPQAPWPCSRAEQSVTGKSVMGRAFLCPAQTQLRSCPGGPGVEGAPPSPAPQSAGRAY